MQLDISLGSGQLSARILYLGKINSLLLKRVWQRNAVLVSESTRFLQVEISRGCRRTNKTYSKTRTFLVGPINQPHRDQWFPVGFGFDPPQDLQARQCVQRTVKPATVRHGIDVSTYEQRFLRLTKQRHPEIARFVAL